MKLQIFRTRQRNNGRYNRWKQHRNHPYINKHPDALLFQLYTNDFEIANPIGSHRKKHKLTAFYWS